MRDIRAVDRPAAAGVAFAFIVGTAAGCASDSTNSFTGAGGAAFISNGGNAAVAGSSGTPAGLGGNQTTGVAGSSGGISGGGVPPLLTGGSAGAGIGGGSGGMGGAGNASGAGNAGGVAGTSGAAGMNTGGGTGDCGNGTGMRGKSSRTVTVGSTKRTFVAYLPQAVSPTTPVPFVYVFHGATQTGSGLYDATEYAKLADTEGIAVVFPDGQATSSATGTGSLDPWSVTDGPGLCGAGGLVSNPNPIDFDFVDAIKVEMTKDQCLDQKHIFATGFSMGGYFSHHIACDRPDFRAAAPHSGATMASLSTCKTTHMPMIIFHGTSDPLIAPGCDDPNSAAQSGFPASATLWAAKNGCKTTYTTTQEMGMNGNNGQCYLYDGCPADGQVELCTFTNLAHAWAGAPVCAGCIGSGAGWPSATALEWAFFKKYAW